MSYGINQDDIINADQIIVPGIICSSDTSSITLMNVEKFEDGQHNVLIKNNSLTNKSTIIDDKKYSNSSLSWTDLYPQVLASCVTLLMTIQPGINLAYSNNLLNHMPSLNKEHISWISDSNILAFKQQHFNKAFIMFHVKASIIALSTPVGAFFIGPIMDRIGRKKACLLTYLPFLASWTISAISSLNNVYMFYVSRLLAGIGGGMTVVAIVHVSEISHASYKQLLLSLNSVFFSGGVLLSTSMAYLPWNVVNYVFITFSVVNTVLIAVCVPESPTWLLKFNSSEYVDKAEAAMKQIYPRNSQVFRAEWKRLKTVSNQDATNEHGPPSFVESVRSSPAAYKPMAIMTGMFLLQQLSGAYPTISYALPILKSIAADDCAVTAAQSLAALGVIRFVSGLLTCLLSFYVGRRPLLMCSCVGMALSSALVTFTYQRPSAVAAAVTTTAALPALCGVMLFVFSSSLGVLVFPWTMACELLPTPARAIGTSLLVSYAYLLMFAVMKTFPYVLAVLSVPNVFLVFGAASFTMAVYVHFFVPETLGKTFQEIEDHFTRAKN